MRVFLMSGALAVAATLPSPAFAQTTEEKKQIAWALERGRLLFALDRAAWVASDDMLARVKDPAKAGLRGYIVDRNGNDLVAIFYAREGERLVAGYRAEIGPKGVASSQLFGAGERPDLTPRQQRLAMTVEQLRKAAPKLTMCNGSPPNVAIVPPEIDDGPVEVYVMTPQTDSNVLPFGGHHKLTFDKDGRIVGQRQFTNSCLAMPLSEKGKPKPTALMVSHLLDPTPTEIHVFSSLAANIPVYVGTRAGIWTVARSGIAFLGRMDENKR